MRAGRYAFRTTPPRTASVFSVLVISLLASCSTLSGGAEGIQVPPSDSLVDVVRSADAVAEFQVTSIQSPHWNSRDGGEWEGHNSEADVPSGAHYTTPKQVTRIHATVVSTLLGDPVPSELEIVVFGDATKRWEGEDPPPSDYSSSGGFVVGDVFIAALRVQEFWYEDRVEKAWSTARGWEGNWRVAGDQAVGSYTRLSVSVEELRAVLSVAWNSR